MKIAIMQPYIFPHTGYFQLIKAVDKFIIYDDVNFIKKGWINRNNILVSNKAKLFTIPLRKSSQNKLIKDIEVSGDNGWRLKFFKTIENSYSKAPFFNETFGIVSATFNTNESSISKIIFNSLKLICSYLEIKTGIVESSTVYNNSDLKSQYRIIDICKKENAEHYINPAGGTELYSQKLFKDNGLKINFIKSKPIQYKQFNNNFTDSLSIIDVLMFNSKDRIKNFLHEYEIA